MLTALQMYKQHSWNWRRSRGTIRLYTISISSIMATVSFTCLAPVVSYRVHYDQLTQQAKAELACGCVGLKCESMGRNLCGELDSVMCLSFRPVREVFKGRIYTAPWAVESGLNSQGSGGMIRIMEPADTEKGNVDRLLQWASVKVFALHISIPEH